MKVDILEHLEDGSQRRVATFRWQEGELTCDNPVLWKHLMNSSGGVVIGARGKRYFPRDGIDYLRNLKYQFAGPYLYARAPEEEGTATPLRPYPTLAAPPSPPEAVRAGRVGSEGGKEKDRAKELPFVRGGPRTLEFRRDRLTGRPSDNPGEVSRDAMERICANVFRLGAALRGLAFDVAFSELDTFLRFLTDLVDIDLDKLSLAYQSRQDYLELAYQPASSANYLKLFERTQRIWQTFLELLAAGDLEECLWPLFLIRECARILPEHRLEWQGSAFFADTEGFRPAATTLQEVSQHFEKAGTPVLRRQGFSPSLLEEVYSGAAEPTEAARTLIRQGSLSKAEPELRRALVIDPGSAETRLVLGDLYRRLELLPPALAETQLAIEQEQLVLPYRRSQLERAEAFLRIARGRWQIGRIRLEDGLVQESIRQMEKALETLDRLSRKVPDESLEPPFRAGRDTLEADLHRMLESLFRDLGDLERADGHRKHRSGR